MTLLEAPLIPKDVASGVPKSPIILLDVDGKAKLQSWITIFSLEETLIVEEKKKRFSIVIFFEFLISKEYVDVFPLTSKSFGFVPSVTTHKSPFFGLWYHSLTVSSKSKSPSTKK